MYVELPASGAALLRITVTGSWRNTLHPPRLSRHMCSGDLQGTLSYFEAMLESRVSCMAHYQFNNTHSAIYDVA